MFLIDPVRCVELALDEHGWTQRREYDPLSGCVCLRGAIKLAVGGAVDRVGRITFGHFPDAGWSSCDLADGLSLAIEEVEADAFNFGVTGWNDTPGRTEADVR